MKKRKLPKDWIVVTSKSHPDRVYYFNVKTNESSWKEPKTDELSKPSASGVQKSKKRKKNEQSSVDSRAVTPDIEETVNVNSMVRQKLVAKRQSRPALDCDTPQMAEIRRKLQQKKAKNAPSKSSASTNSRKSVYSTSETSTTATNSVATAETIDISAWKDKKEQVKKPETLTPQMQILYEKMQERNMNKKGVKQSQSSSNVKNVATVDNTSIARTRRKRNRIRKRSSQSSVTDQETTVSSSTRESIVANDNNARSSLTRATMETKLLEEQGVGRNLSRIRDDPPYKCRETIAGNKDSKSNVIKKGGSVIFKKNLAKERMDKLRRTLNIPGRDVKAIDRLSQSYDESLLQIMDDSELPDLYKTSDARHRNLRNRLLRNKGIVKTDEMIHSVKSDLQGQSLNSTWVDSSQISNDSSCEEMDWEPMEDEKITFEVQAARTQLCVENFTKETLPVARNVLQFPSSAIQEEKETLYIVVDTNVFLSNIDAVTKARDAKFSSYDRPILVVPWTVIRELDYLKDNKSRVKSEHLRAKARKAINYLNDQFSAKHPRVVGQTPEDVANNKERFSVECPDDEILQACLQIRDAGRAVALLSYDKNLCNKAMIYDIVALGRDDPFEKLDYLSSSKTRSSSFHDIYFQNDQPQGSHLSSPFQKELRYSEELFEDIQSTVKEFLSVIVSKEMKNLYGDTWEKYTIVRPPWTVLCVLKCAVKHWLAAVSEAFHRQAEPVLKELLEIIGKIPKGGRKLKDIAYLLEKCSDLTQMIKVEKYPDLMTRASDTVDEYRKRCQNYVNELREKRLRDAIGTEDDVAQRQRRAEEAFKYFNDVYTYARDIGGIAASIVGMPCSFCYQVPNPTPTVEHVQKIQPEIAENVNRLLSFLNAALDEIRNSSIDHRTLLDLYHVLTNFLPEELAAIASRLSPLDVYCCLKEKEDVLMMGLRQLQELSTHFCRLASYRCA